MNKITHIILNVISLLIAICGGLMSLDATVHAVGLFSPQVALWWPVVLASSAAVNRVAVILRAVLADWMDDGTINNSIKLAFFAILLAGLSGCAGFGKSLRYAGKDFLNSTDVTASVNYDGVGVTAARVNGRNKVGVNVDPKQVVRAIKR